MAVSFQTVALAKKDPWISAGVLTQCRTQHPWNACEGFWNGPRVQECRYETWNTWSLYKRCLFKVWSLYKTKKKTCIQLDATLKEQWYLVTVVQLTTKTAAAVRGHVCRGVCGVDPSVTGPVLSGSGHHNSKAFTKLQSDPAERTQICASLNITAPLASVSVGKSHKHTTCSAFKQAFKWPVLSTTGEKKVQIQVLIYFPVNKIPFFSPPPPLAKGFNIPFPTPLHTRTCHSQQPDNSVEDDPSAFSLASEWWEELTPAPWYWAKCFNQ